MAYTTRAKITARIPHDFVKRIAPEPTEDKPEDVLSDIIATINNEIDGYLAGRYSVPFTSPVPAVIQNASLVLSCHALFMRGDRPDDGNPWAKAAEDVRRHLSDVRDGGSMLSGIIASQADISHPSLIFDHT